MKQKDVEEEEEIVNKSVHLFKYIIDQANVCFPLLISLQTCLWAFKGTYFENVPFSVGSIFVPVCPKKLWIYHWFTWELNGIFIRLLQSQAEKGLSIVNLPCLTEISGKSLNSDKLV